MKDVKRRFMSLCASLLLLIEGSAKAIAVENNINSDEIVIEES